ncbi:hypothetical protein FOS14_22430 [Skermania sp. ID1734]|uniref:hypothetical protein n=1 Tax=Skermania sp. ID1734 TaxID=2597516 RepID=UPI00117DC10B|nr:hypothetical protein [Skermania sp. ID1734]TSD93618.1 hypothetical protein FOS14_22430 [Skermania sp. ID1734]
MIGNAIAVWQRHAPLLDACLQARPSDPQLRELWDRFVSQLSDKLAAFIARLRDAGRVDPASRDIPALTHALVGMTVWALYEQRMARTPLPPDRLMNAIRAIWIAAAWGDKGN